MTNEEPSRDQGSVSRLSSPARSTDDTWSFAPAVPDARSDVSGQAPPSYQLAGWGTRFGAFVIDRLITYLVGGVVGFAGLVVTAEGSAAGLLVGVALILLALVFVALFAPLLVCRHGPNNGQTLGKQVFNIKAVRNDGKPQDFGSAMLREFLCKGILPNIAGATVIGVLATPLNFLWPLWDEENRAVHDMLASSHVVEA